MAKDNRGPGASQPHAGAQAHLRYLVVMAARAVADKKPWVLEDRLDELIGEALGPGRSALGPAVDEVYGAGIAALWAAGWQPAEVVRAVRRRWSGRHVDLVITAIAAEHGSAGAPPPEAWDAQLRELGADRKWWGLGTNWLDPWTERAGLRREVALVVTVEAMSALLSLPRIEILMPPPADWHLGATMGARLGSVDDEVLAKVRALLAKADSTSFAAEAEALTAKAQQLMARHAIDDALAHERGAARDAPVARRVPVDDPYAEAKAGLLNVVARANQVRAVWAVEQAFMTLIGFDDDLDAVELLFTSLLVQASKAVVAKGTVSDRRGRSRTRSFRQSFYVAFADRIGERLEAANAAARVDAEAELGRDLLPVLASRFEEVEAEMSRMFPRVSRGSGPGVSNEEGWRAGRVAAELASLGPEPRQLDG
jgi:Protein of unknown function (DUF2786)